MRPNVNWSIGVAPEKHSTYASKAVKAGIPFASQVTEPDTKYIIKYDFDLDDDFTMPDNCILEFDGGSINGKYTITGQNTGINAELVKIFSSDVILDGTWNVVEAYPEWFGAKGDGATDDTTALQKAVESFGNVLLSSTYNISTLTIDNDGMVLSGGTLISNNSGDDTAEIGIVRINSDNVAVRNISIIGNYDETSDTNIIGILVKGEFYGIDVLDEEGFRVIKRKVRNVCVEDCSISAVKYAIYLDVVESCTVSDNTIFNIGYSGITALTCYDSNITNNRMIDININGQHINSYGVCISQHSGNYPYSVGVVVSNNIVKNNPYWEAYDTHSGKKISFVNNIAENVAVGVMLTRSGNSEFSKEPGECIVSGNILNGNLRTNYAGITIVGTPEILGVLDTVLAKGITVTGNNISNFDRGIYGYCTENIVVSENNIYKCNVGINFDSFNSATLTGNHIEIDDMLSESAKYCISLDHKRIDNKKNATINIQANTLKFVGYNSNNTGDRYLIFGTENNRNKGDIINVRNNYMATVRSAEEKAEDEALGIDRCHRWFGTNDVEGKIVNVFRYADVFGVCRYRYSDTTVPANGSVVLFKSGPLFEGQVNMLKEVIHVRDAEGITFRIYTQSSVSGEETKVVAYNNTGNAINMLFGDIFMYFKGRPFILYKEEE